MKSINQAVILAGGKGKRLLPLTLNTPKPMIKIHGKPFLEYVIDNLKKNNIKNVLILTGYLHGQIEKYFQDGKRFGVSISYSYSSVEDETGTRIRKAKDLIDEEFLLMYADNYWPLSISKLYKYYQQKKVQGLVTVYSNLDSYSKNNIYVNKKGIVEEYDKTGRSLKLNGVEIGYFILSKNILNDLPENNFSFEQFVFSKLILKKQLVGFLSNRKYYGLSNLDRIPAIEEFFKSLH